MNGRVSEGHGGGPEPEYRWLGRVGYAEGLACQQRLVERRLAGEGGDVVVMLEHEPVYTVGRSPGSGGLPADEADLPHPLHRINRGGQSTFHGPGQLVVYPVLDLQSRGRDLHAYLRALEKAVIALCARAGVESGRRQGYTGVWVAERKIASIGVGVRRWLTMHGWALNVDMDLSPFEAIVPCGIENVRMTSLALESSRPWGVEEVASWVPDALGKSLAAMGDRS